MRVFLSAYFCAKTGRAFSIGITEERGAGIPRIVYSHDRFEHYTKANLWERVRGKYLVPGSQLRRGPVVLLARDPRDAFVAYYVQLTRRNHPAPDSIKRLAADVLLRDPRYGIGRMVAVMNGWMLELGRRGDFHLVRYEDLRADAASGFRSVLAALGERAIDEKAFAEALRFSSFDNMQTLEARGAFGDKILAPRDAGDRQSFKVRKGNVGGFAEYLSAESQRYAAEVCKRLDSRFGYREEPSPNKY
ncbi:MAG: hypothetical protein DLM52_06170 [Chthoniobacterales bacterium]|nr:MAG: hypothetical protein DLM52_06170 [Chthoniobacterales bacterium]